MAAPETRLSTKGQMVVPKEIRDRFNWGPGTRLSAIATDEGMLVKAAKSEPAFPLTRFEDAYGILKYDGPPISVEDMDKAITKGVQRRCALGRY